MSEASCSLLDSKADLTRLSLIFTEAGGLLDDGIEDEYPTAAAECGREPVRTTLLEDIAQRQALHRSRTLPPPLYERCAMIIHVYIT